MPEVINRMVQLQYTSRIKLDQKLFDKISAVVRLIERIDAELPADSPIRADEDYSFTVIKAKLDPDLTNASDFSRASIEARIHAGYDDARRQSVDWPSAVQVAPPARAARRPAPRPATRKSTTTRARRQPPS